MPHHDKRWIMELDRHAHLSLALPAGTTVCCRSGSVWLTEYRPGKDVILATGDCHRVHHGGTVVISSRRQAQIAICPVDGLAVPSPLAAVGDAFACLRVHLHRGRQIEEGRGARLDDRAPLPLR